MTILLAVIGYLVVLSLAIAVARAAAAGDGLRIVDDGDAEPPPPLPQRAPTGWILPGEPREDRFHRRRRPHGRGLRGPALRVR
ncbi:MAG TPA: hypothetical protein VM266_09425 [Solirubrobacteraceae bacterium]|nr:hypothetical protein [Solirubrobacteraceae bacterium]